MCMKGALHWPASPQEAAPCAEAVPCEEVVPCQEAAPFQRAKHFQKAAMPCKGQHYQEMSPLLEVMSHLEADLHPEVVPC